MTTSTFTIENLTPAQLATFNTLVKLGDSKDLALKTVLGTKELGTEMYQFAYSN